MPQRRTKWELYSDMVTRTAQAQALTAQELDLRNFFQRSNVQFWFHPVWKSTEDQCFYVYDFGFRLAPDARTAGFWLLECSYTAAKPGAAKQYLRKRCHYIVRKFHTAKRRGANTVLLVEALHVPPPVLRHSLPTLDHVDLFFTSVEAFKGWVLDHVEGKDVRQESVANATPKQGDSRLIQLNAFPKAYKIPNFDHGLQNRSNFSPSDLTRGVRKKRDSQ